MEWESSDMQLKADHLAACAEALGSQSWPKVAVFLQALAQHEPIDLAARLDVDEAVDTAEAFDVAANLDTLAETLVAAKRLGLREALVLAGALAETIVLLVEVLDALRGRGLAAGWVCWHGASPIGIGDVMSEAKGDAQARGRVTPSSTRVVPATAPEFYAARAALDRAGYLIRERRAGADGSWVVWEGGQRRAVLTADAGIRVPIPADRLLCDRNDNSWQTERIEPGDPCYPPCPDCNGLLVSTDANRGSLECVDCRSNWTDTRFAADWTRHGAPDP